MIYNNYYYCATLLKWQNNNIEVFVILLEKGTEAFSMNIILHHEL